MGQIRQRGSIYWIRYYRNGRRHEESSHSDKWEAARDLLRLREGDIAKGLPITAKIGRLKFDDAAADVVTDYKVNGKRSLDVLERRITKHLTPFFGGRRMAAITTADVRTFMAQRLEAGASNGEINRELTTLKRAYNLAIQAGKLLAKPYIPLLKERNVRTGFFEADQFKAVRAHLPRYLQPVVTFAYLTGWRIPSEVLTLQWRNVDFTANEVRLDANTTKNDDGRVFPFALMPDLRTLLEDQRAEHKRLQRGAGRKRQPKFCPFVFNHGGQPIKSFKKAWRLACNAAGCPGRIPHDFRRTAVRNLVRAGVSETVAMRLTGHKTRSVFDRYDIVSGDDLREAVGKLSDRLTGTVRGQSGDRAAKAVGETREIAQECVEAPSGFEPEMEVLQTSALPLGYGAGLRPEGDRENFGGPPSVGLPTEARASERRLERETGFEPATSTLARSHSTTELFPLAPDGYGNTADWSDQGAEPLIRRRTRL
jgi:integrase